MNNREINIDILDQKLHHTKNLSILDDLKNFDFSDDIKKKANYIYNQMTPITKRSKNRKLLLFFCIYNAHKELRINVIPADIGKKFGLTQGDLRKANSMFSKLQTGYEPIQNEITINDFIQDYCEKLNLDNLDEIIQFSDNVLKNNKELELTCPQTLAASMLKYYMVSNDIEFNDKTLLSIITNRSNTTIDTIYKKIAQSDNNITYNF